MSDTASDTIKVRTALHEAIELQKAGNLEAAEPRFREVVASGYRSNDVIPILAGILASRGAEEEALILWDELLAIEPENATAHHEKGLILSRTDRVNEGIDALKKSCAADPSNPVTANNLGVMLSDAGRKSEAYDQFTKALILQPGNIHIEHQIRRLSGELVPFWHIPMLNDTRRNDAFEAAIIRALKEAGPEARVLDIGAGSGLLSMMTARAGAQSVTACEMVPVIADTAAKIIKDNGFEDQIDLHALSSKALKVGEHLEERADILVSEILSSDLLTEHVLDTFEDAHARLLKPNATVIPRAATAIGCLVESATLEDYVFVDEVSGFDVSRFGTLASSKLPIHGTMTDWERLSADLELVHIDLTKGAHSSVLDVLEIAVTKDGTATGIVQWMHVDMAQGITFDNHPDTYTDGGWLQVLHNFPQPIKVRAGDVLHLAVGHDRVTLIMYPLKVEEAARYAQGAQVA